MLLKGLKEKMTMRILIFFIFIISIASCSETIDPGRYLSKMAIDLKGDFIIIRQNSSPAIGDLLIEFELKLGQIDYDNVVNSIKSHVTNQPLKLRFLLKYMVINNYDCHIGI
jgi:hypothetical protein